MRRPEPDGDVDPATPARGHTPPDSVQPDSAHSHVLPPLSPAEASGIAEHREQLAVRHQAAAEQLREMAQRAMEQFDSASEGAQTMLDEWATLRDSASRTTGEDACFAALTGELLDVERRRSLRANPAHGALPRVGRLRLLRGPSVRYIGVRAPAGDHTFATAPRGESGACDIQGRLGGVTKHVDCAQCPRDAGPQHGETGAWRATLPFWRNGWAAPTALATILGPESPAFRNGVNGPHSLLFSNIRATPSV